MSDVELTRALERGEIANEGFHHVSHLHVAWVYLTESASVQQGADKMRETLRRFTHSVGAPQKYHETMTLFWVHLLGKARAVNCGKTWCMPIRNCWKRIFRSLTIQRTDFSATKLEFHGSSRT